MSTPASRWINGRISDALARAFDQIDRYGWREYIGDEES